MTSLADLQDWYSSGVNYGEALARSVWEYLRLSDYFRVKYSSFRHGQRRFDSIEGYWGSVIEKTYARYSGVDEAETLKANETVELQNFNFVEWFPWLPGRYWTDWGFGLRVLSKQYLMRDKPESLRRYGDVLRPEGKNLTVLGGVGSVRMREHGLGKSRFKVVGATTQIDGSGAVPVVMSDKAYGRIRRIIETHGSATATLEGVYAELPVSLDDLFHTSWGTPRSCVYVGSKLLVRDARPGQETKVAAWTIYDGKQPDDVNLAFCYFSALDEEGAARAGEFLDEYVSNYHGKPLTDFDEKVQRLEATIPITQVASRGVDLSKLNNFMQRIRVLYPRRSSSR